MVVSVKNTHFEAIQLGVVQFILSNTKLLAHQSRLKKAALAVMVWVYALESSAFGLLSFYGLK